MSQENEKNEVTAEEVIKMYEGRLREQTAIIFGLVAKFGGEVTLTAQDFKESQQYNTVLASSNEKDELTLKIAQEEAPE
jgi:hypothetical protein